MKLECPICEEFRELAPCICGHVYCQPCVRAIESDGRCPKCLPNAHLLHEVFPPNPIENDEDRVDQAVTQMTALKLEEEKKEEAGKLFKMQNVVDSLSQDNKELEDQAVCLEKKIASGEKRAKENEQDEGTNQALLQKISNENGQLGSRTTNNHYNLDYLYSYDHDDYDYDFDKVKYPYDEEYFDDIDDRHVVDYGYNDYNGYNCDEDDDDEFSCGDFELNF